MKKQKNLDYFVGFDIGTNSVGYSVTSEDYEVIRYRQSPMWGVHLFDDAQLANERRTYRAARRRLDRRQQRIQLLRELFAVEIGFTDPKFFQRIDASSLKKESDEIPYAVFADQNYTDRDFYKQYPTIHHLISELIDSDKPHDVRLVYLACAWLLAHRGHFFSDVAKEKVDEIIDFSTVYNDLTNFVKDHECSFSWEHKGIDKWHIGEIMKLSASRTDKSKQLAEYLQIKKKNDAENSEQWFDEYEFLRLLCGLESKSAKLFINPDYDGKLSLDADDEKIAEMLLELAEEDAALIIQAKKVFDWSVLADIIGSGKNLSESKVQIYEKHKSDLKQLKYLVKKYLPHQDYTEIFRDSDKPNYATYSGNSTGKKSGREDFYKFICGKLKKIQIDNTEDLEFAADHSLLTQIFQDIALEKFLPKQVISDNRTIPYQLYWNELRNLLTKASAYLPFLNQQDADGLSVKDKILSIMEFRIPYFVGPLNPKSAWFKRKADGRILPWNFDRKVDLDASEEIFIKRMVNKCTYLPEEQTLPKHSLLYQRFEVLNMLNALHVNGAPVSVDCKQKLFYLFYKYSKVSKKTILNYLKTNNFYQNIDENSISGVDDTITATLSSWRIFGPLLEEKKLTVAEAEEIINKRSFTEDKGRFRKYLKRFSALTEEDIRKLSAKNFQGFGRLSEKFLTEPFHFDKQSGGKRSIINMMWEYNLNLQQLMSENYSFFRMVQEARKEYYAANSLSLSERLGEMYISNAVKRPIIRTLTILEEVTRAMGKPPRKIFVEMARDVTDGKKKVRTVSRMAQLKNLYQQIADEDTRLLARELENYDESALQRDVLYLYFMQLGKDMYTGEPILDLSLCNKEHIYPQSKVKDDSILNNIVLVNSKDNGTKSDSYPIDAKIRQDMTPFWKELLKKGLITAEKFHRLTRSTPFSDDEKWGFINRQLVETRQSTKVVTELIKERYPNSEVVYVKAGLVSDFRHEFDLVKSRTLNDLHHGKDAYLNIVVGNVYHSHFTRNWFLDHSASHYSVKTAVLFSQAVEKLDGSVIWRGENDIERVKKVLKRNYLHLTNYTYCQHGGFFDQMPVKAKAGLIPLKKGKPTEIYGGYNKSAASFFALALTEEIRKNAKKELTLVPVDLMVADKFLQDETFAVKYMNEFKDASGQKRFNVTFPLGLKPIKIKTVFEVDNSLRFRLNGKSSGGKEIGISLFTPLLLDNCWEKYVKRLESFSEKKHKNASLVCSEKYDQITAEQNTKLFDILLAKLQTGMFAKRPANPHECLVKGREKFIMLSLEEQVKILLAIVNSLGTGSGRGMDLNLLGGKQKTGVTTLRSCLCNWKKTFSEVRIIYSDASGLHETKSINLMDLI